MKLNEDDVVFTIFTDSAEMYQSRLPELTAQLGVYSSLAAHIDWSATSRASASITCAS